MQVLSATPVVFYYSSYPTFPLPVTVSTSGHHLQSCSVFVKHTMDIFVVP